jgi:hypothetical protein
VAHLVKQELDPLLDWKMKFDVLLENLIIEEANLGRNLDDYSEGDYYKRSKRESLPRYIGGLHEHIKS